MRMPCFRTFTRFEKSVVYPCAIHLSTLNVHVSTMARHRKQARRGAGFKDWARKAAQIALPLAGLAAAKYATERAVGHYVPKYGPDVARALARQIHESVQAVNERNGTARGAGRPRWRRRARRQRA